MTNPPAFTNPDAGIDVARRGRLDSYLESFAGNQNHPQMSLYPGLSADPWHEGSKFAVVSALENAFADIRREAGSLAESRFRPESERIFRTGSWDVLMFYERGYKNVDNCRRCPEITRVIRNSRTVRSLCGAIYVSRLGPGTHIAPHRGPTNMRLRCHLALKVPSGDCGLRVGGEVRRWEQGKCLVFDDSFEHEAWNATSEDRVVLVVDIWHPDLSTHEIAILEGLQRYATTHASNLSRYWARNAPVPD